MLTMSRKTGARVRVDARSKLAKQPSRPDRTAWKKRLDLILYLLFCSLAGTGFLLAYRFPHGPSGSSLLFIGFDRHEWGDIHTWLAYAAIGIAAIHLLLNWRWLVKVAASRGLWQLVTGIATGLLIIGFFVLAPVEKRALNKKQNLTEETDHPPSEHTQK
jgi:uncharacterized protein DUF4405